MSDIKAIHVNIEYIKGTVDEIKKDVKSTNNLTIKNQQKIWFLEKVVYGGVATVILAIMIFIIKGLLT